MPVEVKKCRNSVSQSLESQWEDFSSPAPFLKDENAWPSPGWVVEFVTVH